MHEDALSSVRPKPNRPRHHATLREAFIAFVNAHAELTSHLCDQCAEGFERGDEHPLAVDALFACMSEDLGPQARTQLREALTEFFLFDWEPTRSRGTRNRHRSRRRR